MKRSKHGLFVFPLKKTLIWKREVSKRSIHCFLDSSSGRNFFQPSVRQTNQKPRAFVSVRQTNQIALFSFVCCFCLVRAFSFQGHTKIALTYRVTKVRVVFGVTTQTLENFRFQDEDEDEYENEIFSILVVRVREQASFWRENYRFHREYRSGGNKLQMLCIFCARDREKA